MNLACIIAFGLPVLFLIWMIAESFVEGSWVNAVLGVLMTPFIFFIGIIASFLICGLIGGLIADCGAPIVAVSSEVQELTPMNKNYYVAVDPDGEDSTKYRYAIPNEDGSFTMKETCGESVKFTFIDVNDDNADLTPSITITDRAFKNPVLAFCFVVPDEYSFNIYEDSMLNVGIPVI